MNGDDHPILRNKNMIRREIINHFASLANEANLSLKGDARLGVVAKSDKEYRYSTWMGR